ncbi:MAG: alpha/beta hydrolase [Pseudomonadota bacterium]|nr:alpha/beta hydrolase [Pseudomonadota bacterium]
MAVVVTVHGTGDTNASPDGDYHWWQRSGRFARSLSERLPALADSIEPFIWSGENSERARRSSADAFRKEFLPDIISRLPAGDSIHIISHSHGSNVVAEALLDLSIDDEASGVRQRIASWTAVGAPFFRYQPNMEQGSFLGRVFLGARMAFGLIIFAALVGFLGFAYFKLGLDALRISDAHTGGRLAAGLSELYSQVAAASEERRAALEERGGPSVVSTYIGIALNVIIWGGMLSYAVWAGLIRPLLTRARLDRRRHEKSLEKRYLEFCNKFVNIHSEFDEALAALSVFNDRGKGKKAWMSRIFDVPALRWDLSYQTAWMSFILVIVCLAAFSFPVASAFIAPQALSENAFNIAGLRVSPSNYVILSALGFYVLLIVIFPLAVMRGRKHGAWIENAIERVFQKRLESASLGDDFPLEGITGIETFPEGFEKARWNSLPARISENLRDFTERHSTETLNRLRRAMAKSAFVGDPADLVALLAKEVTYRELVHTNYFQAPEICDLIAYGLMAHDDSLKEGNWIARSPDKAAEVEDLFRKTKGSYGRAQP